MSETQQLNQEEVFPGFNGARFQQLREERGLSLDDVARQLHLTRFYVQALEAGDFSRLPKPPFVRGYIKGYAKLLGMQPDYWLQPYEAMLQQTQPSEEPVIRTVSRVKRQARLTDPLMRWFTALFVGGLVLLTLLWWKEQYHLNSPSELFTSLLDKITVSTLDGEQQIILNDPAEQPVVVLNSAEAVVNDEPPQVNQPEVALQSNSLEVGSANNSDSDVSAPVATVTPITEEATAALNPVAPTVAPLTGTVTAAPAAVKAEPLALPQEDLSPGVTESPTLNGPANNVVPGTQPVDTTPPPPELAAGMHRVRVTFKADCWFQIQDGNGRKHVAAIKSAGDVVELDLKGPIRIVAGYLPGIDTILLDGKAVDLSGYDGRDVVRLSLP